MNLFGLITLFSSAAGSEESMYKYHALAFIAVILLIGYVFGKLAELAHFPHITGYLIGGIIVGIIAHWQMPDVIVHSENGLTLITDIGLGFIAFSIGMELWFPKLRKSGKKILIVTAFQSLITTFVVLFGLLLIGVELWVACALAGIAAATAPGPLLMIIKQYKAKGELTDTVIPVVGLDDAFGIMIFGILFSVAVMSAGGTFNLIDVISVPLQEILISLLIGIAIGIPFALIVKVSGVSEHEKSEMFLSLTLVVIFAAVAIAKLFALSPILLPMAIGVTFTNLIDKDTFKFEERVMDGFQPPVMVAFFAVAGIELGDKFGDMSLFMTVAGIGTIYVILRSFGKMFGAYLGTTIAKSSQKVRKWLGICLLPQAGIAIGMSLQVAQHPQLREATGKYNGQHVQIIILIGVILYELFGPSLVTWSLKQTGEIQTKK